MYKTGRHSAPDNNNGRRSWMNEWMASIKWDDLRAQKKASLATDDITDSDSR
jgi:hypothetical protein